LRDRQRHQAFPDGGVSLADAGRQRQDGGIWCWRPISSRSRCGSNASGCCQGCATAHRLHAWARHRIVLVCLFATTLGYGLAANLPPLLGAAILLLTPLAFLLSTARNCRQLSDVLALVLGLALFPLVSLLHTGVDILISGISAGTIAYGVHWWRERE
jgi:hypothetical protein